MKRSQIRPVLDGKLKRQEGCTLGCLPVEEADHRGQEHLPVAQRDDVHGAALPVGLLDRDDLGRFSSKFTARRGGGGPFVR